jgi:type 1 fimbria pilin
MASLKFQKSALTVSFSAALLSLSVATQAQAVNDFGELLIEGQISTSTCVLSMGDNQATGAGKKTVNLGTYKAADFTSTAVGTNIGAAQSTVLRVKGPDGVTDCALGGAGFWDVGINISNANYETLSTGVTVLKSTATSGIAATGVGVKLTTSTGTAVLTGSTNILNFAAGNGSYGTLLSGGAASAPALTSANAIAVTAQMVKTFAAATAPTAGVFTQSIPLNVWYK